MKICCLVKEVPDAVQKRIDPESKRLDRSGEKNLNPLDTYGIEAAVGARRVPPADAAHAGDFEYPVYRDFFLRRVPVKGRTFSYERPGLSLTGRLGANRASGSLFFERTVKLSENDTLTCRTRQDPNRWKAKELPGPNRD